MPKLSNPITDLQIKRTKPGSKVHKLPDGGGLYLEILPNGSRFWRFRFRQHSGKESTVSFGPYPEVSLAAARKQRDAARRWLHEGGGAMIADKYGSLPGATTPELAPELVAGDAGEYGAPPQTPPFREQDAMTATLADGWD